MAATLWFTGLPGSGKSAVATAVHKTLTPVMPGVTLLVLLSLL